MSIVVATYDPGWAKQFDRLHGEIAAAVGELAVSIEHVGSTSVFGLAAKPIIDLTIIVADESAVEAAITRLAGIGYVHRGDLGVAGREAFSNPPHAIAHHLYLCPQGSLGLRNHLAFRDHLRSHPDVALEYGQLKRRLAAEFPDDMEAYIDGKTAFVLQILQLGSFDSSELGSIEDANRKP